MATVTLVGRSLTDWGIPVAVTDDEDLEGRHPLTLGGFLAATSKVHGNRTALVFGDKRWTFEQLYADARRAARACIAIGLGKGSRVAVLMSNRPEWVISTYGAAMIGAVVTPISTLATAEERAYVLRHSDSSVLFCQKSLRSHKYLDDLGDLGSGASGALMLVSFPELRRVVCLESEPRPGVESFEEFLARGDAIAEDLLTAVAKQVSPTDDGVIIYTSGTTAMPKGVLHMNRAPVLQSWQWCSQLGLGVNDRVLSPYPFFWTAGFSRVLGGTLAAGATLVMQEIFDVEDTLRLVDKEQVTALPLMSHQDAALAEYSDLSKFDLSSLRFLNRGSALAKVIGLPEDHEDPAAAYGLSETFTIATSLPSNAPAELRLTTHGKALPGMAVRIADAATNEEMPAGEIGEITLKGVTMMRCYYKVDPENCFDTYGFFHTNDAGFLDEGGYLHFSGRTDGLIKTAGANVSPLEVEAAVVASGKVRAAYAVGLPHPTLGSAVVLCVIPREQEVVTEEEIRSDLVQRIAKYKIPRRVEFFSEAEIPFTANEKVKLPELRELLGRRLAARIVDDEAWQKLLVETFGDDEK
jgi:fatty-acyl-CoA synthase